jgi:hypothetical protein
METLFNPPRDLFNINNYDDNLNIQHEALKRLSNHHIDEVEQTPIFEKMPAPVKPKRRTKKDIKDLMA